MSDPTLIERIRSIFLYREPRVTVAVAARLLGRSEDAMTGAIDDGIIETVTTCSGPMIDIRELAEEAVHTWPLVMIEKALGAEASLVLPPDVRTRKFTLRLPRYIISALHQLAEDEGETVEGLITRELHGLAYAYRKRLAAAIPGFTEALEWPLVEAAKPDC